MSHPNIFRGWFFWASLAVCDPSAGAGADAALGNARVAIQGDRISVSTGGVERTWHWTGSGLVTVSLRDQKSGRDWAVKPQRDCDWDLPGAITKGAKATLVSTESRISDDDGFSGRHLELVSTIRYDEAKLLIQHIVWAIPDAPGLRTQLRVKALPGFDPKDKPTGDFTFKDFGATFLKPSARAEYLPLDFTLLKFQQPSS